MSFIVPFIQLGLLLLSLLAPAGLAAHANHEIPLTAEEEDFIAGHPEIILGYGTDSPPMLIGSETGDYSGVLPDFVRLLNLKLGTNIRIKVSTWEVSVAEAQKHATDGLGLTMTTPDLRSGFIASRPVFSTFLYLFVRAEQEGIESLADLESHKVGYLEHMQGAEQLLLLQPVASVSTYPNVKALMAALAVGEIDAVLGDASVEYWRKQHGASSFRAAGILPESKSDVAFLLRGDEPMLASLVNKGLAAMTDTEKQAILDRWYGTSLSPWTPGSNALQLSEKERVWLAANPIIWVGFDPMSAPVEFLDDQDQPQGISIEYLRRLEPMLKVRFEYAVGRSWTEVQQQVAKGTLDMLSAIPETEQRRQMFNFTQPYLSVPIVIFSAVNSTYLGGVDALDGHNVVVLEDSAIQGWLERDYPELDLTTAQDIKEALRLLMQDENAVFVGNLITSSYYIGQSGLLQIRVVGETPYTNQLRMGVRKDWELFPNILQKALHAIPQYERDMIYNDWISIKYRHDTDYSMLFKVLGLGLVVLVLIVYWNLRLSREIQYRHRVEAELVNAKRAAELASQAKSEFLANISHELRTPMHAVLGFTTLLQQAALPKGKQGQYLQGIQAAGTSLLQLIDDILDLTKAEAGKLELQPARTDLRKLIRDIEATFAYRATDKNLKLYYQVASDLPNSLWLDETRLRQILVNLIGNAIKFTEVGFIFVQVSSFAVKPGWVRLRMAVRDTGIGVPEDQQEVIFGLFNQCRGQDRARYKGTGLGLAISQRLASLMGGKIYLNSRQGVGSTFTLVLPLVPIADIPGKAREVGQEATYGEAI